MVKDLRFYLRLDDKDRRLLNEVAEALSVQPSQAVRVLVREKHRELFGVAQTPTVATRKRRKR
jgi:hypothetical protein